MHPNETPSLIPSLIAQDASEAQITAASSFLEGVYGESAMPYSSRAATPMTVCDKKFPSTTSANDASVRKKKRQGLWEQWDVLGLRADSESRDSTATQEGTVKGLSAAKSDKQNVKVGPNEIEQNLPSKLPFWGSPRITRTKAKLRFGTVLQDTSFMPPPPVPPKRHAPPHPSTLPTLPDVSHMTVSSSNMDYTILVSMYEVYNDRIFDLLTNPRGVKDAKRRALLFKSTEGSPDRKVVAGLRKVVCGTYEEALMVLETGLLERRVAGTGSNSVSSRSHGFFCVEVKKKFKSRSSSSWNGAQLTIVDLAGKYITEPLSKGRFDW